MIGRCHAVLNSLSLRGIYLNADPTTMAKWVCDKRSDPTYNLSTEETEFIYEKKSFGRCRVVLSHDRRAGLRQYQKHAAQEGAVFRWRCGADGGEGDKGRDREAVQSCRDLYRR